jgi:DnaB-like helicase N terminal domain
MDLTYRAEQAVLGALLTDPARAADAGLGTADFADRRHQAIFAALTGQETQALGLFARVRDWLRGSPLRREAQQVSAYMANLPAACPEPANLGRYVQMVTEARHQRAEAAAAERQGQEAETLARAAAWLAQSAQQAGDSRSWLRSGVQPGSGEGQLPDDVALLARSLRAPGQPAIRASQSVAAAPGPQQLPALGQRLPATGGQSVTRSRADRPRPAGAGPIGQQIPVQRRPGLAAPRRPLGVRDVQDMILADLLQHPGYARDVISWLPAEMFKAGPRRDLYLLISALIRDEQPVDPLVIAWDVGRSRDLAARDTPEQVLDPDYVLRMGAIRVGPGSAAVLGRGLLADAVCTKRFGADWPKSELLTRPVGIVIPSRAPEPERAPEPAAVPVPLASVRPARQVQAPPTPSPDIPGPQPRT